MNNAQCNYKINSPKASFSNLSFMEADNINLTCQVWNLIIVKCVSYTEVYCLIIAASTRAWIVHYYTFFYEMKRRLVDNVNFTFRKIVCIKCASNTMYCPIIATSKYPIHGTQSLKPLYLLAQSYFLFLALLFFPSYNISWHPCILCISWVHIAEFCFTKPYNSWMEQKCAHGLLASSTGPHHQMTNVNILLSACMVRFLPLDQIWNHNESMFSLSCHFACYQ